MARASRLAARDRRALVPGAWGFWSARRYLSLYRPGEAEDVFPYAAPALAGPRSGSDPRAAGGDGRRPRRVLGPVPNALIDAFAARAVRAESFTGHIIPGALHGFQPREAAVARAVVDWIRDRRL